jgi:glycosyltransferase involved in cell wall biosynthesis
MKIFAGHDGGSGCMYYRIELPLRQLQKHGHQVTFMANGDQGTMNETGVKPVTLRDMEGHDVIVGQRYNNHVGLQAWRRARTPLSRLVYETDDDVFTVTPENWAAYRLFNSPDIQDAVTHGAQIADLVTVTTEHLGEVIRKTTGCENVAVLPNCIPEFVLGMPREPTPRPRVGWQGGASHGVDVGLVVQPVRRFLKRFPGWDLRLAGTDYRPTFKAGKQATFGKWKPVYQDPPAYYATLDFDIGLAPLAVTEFNLSKSNVKVLEYAARGIPAVATDCEIYRSFIRHGENGFLVSEEHEWLKYLSVLANDDGLRAKMGEQARQDVRAWTIEKNWPRWEKAYASLFKSQRVA